VRNKQLKAGFHDVRVVFSSTGAAKNRRVSVAPGEHKVVRFQGGR
jgi:hypothetical protein